MMICKSFIGIGCYDNIALLCGLVLCYDSTALFQSHGTNIDFIVVGIRCYDNKALLLLVWNNSCGVIRLFLEVFELGYWWKCLQ